MQFDISQPATYIPIIAGVIIPFAVAWLTKPTASGTVKALLAALASALTALGLYLSDTAHVTTWEGALSAFILALVIAVTSRVSLTGHKVDELQALPTGVIG